MAISAIYQNITWKYTYHAYAALFIVSILNVYLTLSLPVSNDSAGSEPLIRSIGVGIALVQTAIWFVAVTAATGLMSYVQKIRGTVDGEGMRDIAMSMMLLIGYIVLLPITSMMAVESLHLFNNHAFFVLHNHIPLLLILCATAIMYRGSRRLVRLAAPEPAHKHWRIFMLSIFTVFLGFFVGYFATVVPAKIQAGTLTLFTFSTATLLTTYVLPMVVAWIFGMLAVLNLWQYSTQVEGMIYRELFRNLYQGIILVFVAIFTAQLVMAANVSLTSLNVSVVLVFALLLVGMYGYVLVLKGVQHLNKLEA